MEKTTKKKVKKAILGVTSVALVAGVTSALTMAMLSDFESAENTFTATPNLTVEQVEPKWDGTNPSKLPNGRDPGYMDGNGSDQVYTSGDTGETTARSYVPDKPIAKNPYAVNTSTSPEYVALRVYYQVLCRRDQDLYKGEGCCGTDYTSWHTISVEDFHKYFAETSYSRSSANYNDNDFYKVTGDDGYSEYYYYGNSTTMKSLTSYFATPEIFDAVTPVESLNECTKSAHADHHMFRVPGCTGCDAGRYIVQDIDPDGDDDYLYGKGTDKKAIVLAVGDDDGLPEFRIVVQTAAIQTSFVNGSNNGNAQSDVSTVRAELAKCFPDVPDKNSLSD